MTGPPELFGTPAQRLRTSMRTRPCDGICPSALVLALGAALGAALAEPPSEVCEPLWRWESPPGIEWVERPHGARAALLVGTRDARVHALDAGDGRDLLREPIQGRPGVRPVPADPAEPNSPQSRPTVAADANPSDRGQPFEPRLAYCYDRSGVYAIDVGPRVGLRWSVSPWNAAAADGTASEPAHLYAGDPEQLRQLVAARGTRWGVLVARDDGRLALLDRAEGQMRWTRMLPPLAHADLHASAETGALLWKERSGVAAALFDVSSGAWLPLAGMDEPDWPIWSALAAHRLVIVHPERVVICGADRPVQKFPVQDGGPVLAAAVAPYVGRPGGPARRGSLILGQGGGTIRALDLETGETCWTTSAAESGGAHWTSLHIEGDVVIAATRDGAVLCEARTGQLLGSYAAGPRLRLLDVGLARGSAYLLTAEERGEPSVLWVEKHVLEEADGPAGASTPDTAVARGGRGEAKTRLRLSPADVFLNALWMEGRLIVADKAGLRAYALP